MIRIVAKLFAVTVALTLSCTLRHCLRHLSDMCRVPALMATLVPLHCLARLPRRQCGVGRPSGDIACLNFPSIVENDTLFGTSNVVTIDCAGVLNMSTLISATFEMNGNVNVKIRTSPLTGCPADIPRLRY